MGRLWDITFAGILGAFLTSMAFVMVAGESRDTWILFPLSAGSLMTGAFLVFRDGIFEDSEEDE